MSGRLSEKIAVITGASMGIGEALARLFVEEGASVVMAARDQARLDAARSRISKCERTLAVMCDVSNRKDVDRVLSLTLHNFGRVDIWVNNAGLGLHDSVEMMDRDACRRMFDTNLFGAIDAMQAAIPVMKRQGKGTIINVSSAAGHIPVPFQAAYSATKSALNAISSAARMELASSGVHILTVCPGYVATDFRANRIHGHDSRQADFRRHGAPAESVARDILRAYLKGKREIYTPWYYWLPARLYDLLPQLVEGAMVRRIKNT